MAHTLVERVPATLGAAGAALGLLDGDVLQIVDPAGSPRQTIPPGTRLPLDALAPITIAARTGEVTFASTRDRFEQDFPDGAALAPYAAGALAVPLRAGGKIVGSMGFPFREPDAIDDEVLAVARLAADLGGQALERAGLYEQERQSREGLDRIVRLAPRFDSESPESVVEMICKEAMTTFGSDIAQLWARRRRRGVRGRVARAGERPSSLPVRASRRRTSPGWRRTWRSSSPSSSSTPWST